MISSLHFHRLNLIAYNYREYQHIVNSVTQAGRQTFTKDRFALLKYRKKLQASNFALVLASDIKIRLRIKVYNQSTSLFRESKMPLNIPALQIDVSIRPVFVTIIESLVTDINQRIRDITDSGEINSANLARHVRLESLLKFVQNIDPITLNINDLHQSLLQSGALDSEEIEPYINGIRDELGRCLKQTNNNGSNALMFTSQRYPAEVIPILLAMSNLNKDQQFEILNQATSFDHYTALMIAVKRGNPDEVSTILWGMRELNQDQQFEILMQVTSRGFNALRIASENYPKAVALILQAVTNLSQDHQFDILKQVTPQGSNALMSAANVQSDAVVSILRSIKDLNQDQQFEILMQVTSRGFNALMIASRSHPMAIVPILEAINRLSEDQQFKILSQVFTPDGYNALVFAAKKHPEVVTPILDAMKHLSQEQQFDILKQVTPQGSNALMSAAIYPSGSDAVAAILRSMKHLDQVQQFEILMQVTSWGYNALMFASQNHPKAVAPILEVMNRLSEDQQFDILKQVTPDGFNALMLAAQFQPEVVASILRPMKHLSPEQQLAILSQASRYRGSNALMIALQMHPAEANVILQAMNNLIPEQQFAILSEVSTPEGSNALMLAAQSLPEAATPILQVINYLSPREKIQILLQSNDKGNSALEFLARHGKSGVNPALRLAREAIDTIYNQDKTNPISTAASSSAASSSSDVTPVTSGHSFFSNNTTTNPPERIEQLLIDKLILAVEVAQKKYSNYVKSGTKRSSEFNRGNSPSPISSLLHNDTGSEKSLTLSAIISESSDVISIKKELCDFFNAKDTTYHAHSFVSYLIDELIRITPEAKIKPSTRYNKTMLTPLLDAIGNNPSKGTSGALDRDELESGHNTVVIG